MVTATTGKRANSEGAGTRFQMREGRLTFMSLLSDLSKHEKEIKPELRVFLYHNKHVSKNV